MLFQLKFFYKVEGSLKLLTFPKNECFNKIDQTLSGYKDFPKTRNFQYIIFILT